MLINFGDTSHLNILVIGDIILDTYIHGEINRMSPEAPVPVVNKLNKTHILGGSANVAANINSLGAKTTLLGIIGNDKAGSITNKLINEQIEGKHSLIMSARISTEKTRIIVNQKQVIRIDDEQEDVIDNTLQNKIYEEFENIISTQNIDGIILQDYDKGLFSQDLIERIIESGRKNQIPTFVDPKFKNFWYYNNCTVFKPNKKELLEASLEATNHLNEIVSKTFDSLGCELLICTLAEEGMLYRDEESTEIIPTQKIKTVDVSGAGDTTLAIITLSYLMNYSTREIVKLGNIVGKLSCLKSGVCTISRSEINKELQAKN